MMSKDGLIQCVVFFDCKFLFERATLVDQDGITRETTMYTGSSHNTTLSKNLTPIVWRLCIVFRMLGDLEVKLDHVNCLVDDGCGFQYHVFFRRCPHSLPYGENQGYRECRASP